MDARLRVEALSADRVSDLASLFGCDPVADRCWCMWFIRPVKEFHAAGREGNREAFETLVRDDPSPLGLLAYSDGEPVGWCAAGPRSRFERMLRSPTLRDRDRSEDTTAWLVPCFFVRPQLRESGVARALLNGAVALAARQGAAVVEGFPLAGTRRRSGGSDFQTGVEALFADCGFQPVHRPSANRVIMRRSTEEPCSA